MLERDVESKVCVYARSKGFLAYKFTSPARAAVPDRLFITPTGRHFFIEFKATGKEATDAQLREHRVLRNNGAYVHVVNDVEKGKEIIDLWGV